MFNGAQFARQLGTKLPAVSVSTAFCVVIYRSQLFVGTAWNLTGASLTTVRARLFVASALQTLDVERTCAIYSQKVPILDKNRPKP